MKNFKAFLILSSLVSSVPILADEFGGKVDLKQKEKEISAFAEAWNSDEFQAEITKMMNVYPDLKKFMLPKLAAH
jgi:hypothetical protein